jgi:FkbM family methyltransferase
MQRGKAASQIDFERRPIARPLSRKGQSFRESHPFTLSNQLNRLPQLGRPHVVNAILERKEGNGMRALGAIKHLDRLPEILRCRQLTPQWLRLTSAYIGLNSGLPFEIALRSGTFTFRETGDIATFWQIFCREIYRVDDSDRLIVDAGANIGAFSLYALRGSARASVIAIEPAPDSCNRLRDMLRAHGMESRCTLHEAALGAVPGQTTIQLDVGSQFRRSGTAGNPVQMVTLESVVPPDAIVDLLKIDIEGAEYEVFKSASVEFLRRVRRIVMEYHPVSSPEEAIGPLVSSGFTVVRRQDDGEGYGVVWLTRAAGGL